MQRRAALHNTKRSARQTSSAPAPNASTRDRARTVDNRADYLSPGHINHSLFWKNLAPSASEKKGHGGQLHDGPLKKAITDAFGSFDAMKKEFNTTTAGIQGSGWGWLVSVPLNAGRREAEDH